MAPVEERRFVGLVIMASIAISVFAVGCSSDSSSGCIEQREAEDPQSGRHVLSPDNLVYLTDPPTSGPHSIGPLPQPVLASPLPSPIQVAVLEAGGVMIQYDSSLDASVIAELEARANGDLPVVVAPGDELDSPIVATAWTWKLSCSSLDDITATTEALAEFEATRTDAAPGRDVN